MNALQEMYKDNLVIMGFPCNQFGLQEPGGTGLEIYNGIKYVRPGKSFEPNFLIVHKTEVNGENEHPLYAQLKLYCPPTRLLFSKASNLYYSPMHVTDIRWNWEKFLISRNGKPYKRYDSSINPKDIANDVEYLINNVIP